MGICSSCFKNSSTDYVTPDMETRRQQQAAAAEKRLQEQDSRGIKNVDKVRRQQQRKEEMERREEEAAKQGGQGGLKVRRKFCEKLNEEAEDTAHWRSKFTDKRNGPVIRQNT